MTEANGFKHIKVAPVEEPEVVIHAGAPREVPEKESRDQEDLTPPVRPDRPKRASSQSRQGTTLEDIKGSRMPKTQLAVIILALLAIIAFAVWYAFFS